MKLKHSELCKHLQKEIKLNTWIKYFPIYFTGKILEIHSKIKHHPYMACKLNTPGF